MFLKSESFSGPFFFFFSCCDVDSLGEVLGFYISWEFEGGHPLNAVIADTQWGWIPLVFPEVGHQLLSFDGVEQQVVFRTPTCQLVDPSPIYALIPLADEAEDCDVICKCNNGIGGIDYALFVIAQKYGDMQIKLLLMY